MNICYVFVGDISFEIKTETDCNGITECSHDDKPNSDMFLFLMLYSAVSCLYDVNN